jgi:hypothetical protein
MAKKQQTGMTKAENFVKRFLEDKQGMDKQSLHSAAYFAIKEKLGQGPGDGRHLPPEYKEALTKFIY